MDVPMFRRTISILALGLIALATGPVAAQPDISDVDINPYHKATVTVTGNHFGFKGHAEPVIWSDFEDGTAGSTDIHGWGSYTFKGDNLPAGPVVPEPPIYVGERPRGQHSLSVRTQMWGWGHPNHVGAQWGCRITKFDDGVLEDYDFTTGYLSFWASSDSTLNGGPLAAASSNKFIQWYGSIWPENYPIGPPKIRSTCADRIGCEVGIDPSLSPRDYNDQETSSIRTEEPTTSPWMYGTGWHRYESEHEFKGEGNINSWTETRIDNEKWARATGAFTGEATFNPDAQHRWVRRFTIMHHKNFTGGCNDGQSEYIHHFDEIYADTVRARIEIGNAETFDQCTHREIQYPVDWSTTSVSFVVNQGDFSVGQPAWLYVIDRNGVANPSGYPITFAGTGDSPGMPLNAQINDLSP